MFLASFSGLVTEPKRLTTWPSRPMRNLVKFHLILSPIRPDFSPRSHWNSGWAVSPLTSTLSKTGKVTP